MTPAQRFALESLKSVNFGFGSAHRFVCDVASKPEDYELTPRQAWNLHRLCWSYRRQLPREISDWALECGAGAAPPAVAPKQPRAPVVTVSRPTKRELAVAALARPIRFGDEEQVRAVRRRR